MTPSTPFAARSISSWLKMRKITILGKTQRDMICVSIPAVFTFNSHSVNEGSPLAKKKTKKRMIKGRQNPLIVPVDTLSYFSRIVIR